MLLCVSCGLGEEGKGEGGKEVNTRWMVGF